MSTPRSRGAGVAATGALTVVMMSAVVAVGTSQSAAAGGERAERSARPSTARTVITVRARTSRHRASTSLLGINHHYNANGFGLWDPTTDAARPVVVAEARRAGVQVMRFPGGSVAIPYDWRRAIGPERGCQVDGNHPRNRDTHQAIVKRLRYGPDEYMRSLRAMRARPFLMVPSMTSTPKVAADFVEYMNAPSGTADNPNGGTDWAEVRAANGHPAPYGVRYWEIGNEPMHTQSRNWMSRNDGIAVRQYAFGGSKRVTGEGLGRMCAHPAKGVASDGSAGQVFEMLWPPVAAGSQTVTVGSQVWTAVDSLSGSGPDDRVYTFRPETGSVMFGDGVNGAIPRAGRHVHADYRSVHKGFFDFAQRMKEVDPTIKVCPSWGRPLFTAVAKGLSYDCLTDHPVTSYVRRSWKSEIDGHDKLMLAADRRAGGIERLLDSMPPRVPLILSEFAVLRGDWEAYPTWAGSASEAVYMATDWAHWMNLRVAMATGGALTWTNNRAAFGSSPDFVYSAEALTREAIKPMFREGGRVLSTSVAGNPRRDTQTPSRDSYHALVVTATRTPSRDLLVMVVNRLPGTAVRARIQIERRAVAGRVKVRTVSGRRYTSANDVGRLHAVRLHRYRVRTDGHGLVRTFPAASTTLLRFTPR